MKATTTLTSLAVAGVLLVGAGCGGNDDASGPTGDTDNRAAADASDAGSDQAANDQSAEDDQAAPPDGTEDALIPVAVGNQWTYKIDYPGSVGTVTQTQEITAVEPVQDGTAVTFANNFHYDDGSQPDFAFDLEYTFHSDGSISVPYNAFTVGETQFASTSTEGVVWPSYPELVAGATHQGEATGQFTQPGLGKIEAAYAYTSKGAGTQSVTVPAGSYQDAAVMTIDLDITVADSPAGPLDLPITLKSWFAEGVGMVKQEVGGDFMPGTELALIDAKLQE
jgi:hypothetical protein